MTTNVSIRTGHRAAAVTVTSERNENVLEGNTERSSRSFVQTAQFIPPNSVVDIVVCDDENARIVELAENVRTIDDLRRSDEGIRMATADLDEPEPPVNWDEAFEQQAQGSDNRDPAPAAE